MEEIVGKFKKEVDGGHVSGPHMVPTAFFVHFPIGSCAPPPPHKTFAALDSFTICHTLGKQWNRKQKIS